MFDSLKVSLTQKLHPVHIAESFVDLEAIWCYRFKVCVKEYSMSELPDLQHENGWLRYDSDEEENTTVYYAGGLDNIHGTIAVRSFKPGEVPEDVSQFYSLDMFNNIENKKVIEMSSHSFETTPSGKAAATALAYKAFEKAIEEKGEILFVSCLPEHLNLYQDLGLRPYGAKALNDKNEGLMIPLVGLMDIKYYEELHSPLYHIFKNREDDLVDVSSETEAMLDLIYEASGSAESDSTVIKNEITLFFKDSILEQTSTFNFLTFMPEQLINRIAESSTLVNLEADQQVIQANVHDQELYFVMSGNLEVRRGRRSEDVLAKKGKGDIVGEIGFLRETGKRAASVFTTEKTRLLVIRKSFLNNLVKKHPREACIFYDALGRAMVEAIANS